MLDTIFIFSEAKQSQINLSITAALSWFCCKIYTSLLILMITRHVQVLHVHDTVMCKIISLTSAALLSYLTCLVVFLKEKFSSLATCRLQKTNNATQRGSDQKKSLWFSFRAQVFSCSFYSWSYRNWSSIYCNYIDI